MIQLLPSMSEEPSSTTTEGQTSQNAIMMLRLVAAFVDSARIKNILRSCESMHHRSQPTWVQGIPSAHLFAVQVEAHARRIASSQGQASSSGQCT